MKNAVLTLGFCLMLCANNLAAQTPINLSNVTIGFGAGYSYILSEMDEYSLSTDTVHALKVSPVTGGGFVISSVITVRLGKVAKVSGSNKLYSQNEIAKLDLSKTSVSSDEEADPGERWTLNLAINLAEVNSEGLSFNKAIDGGLGLGYSFSDNIQLALFLDCVRVRQLRPYIVDTYKDLPIPKGKDVYTALDPNDNELFTTRTMTGVSIKLVYTLANPEG